MVDQNRIILMSKIALYEKRYMRRDQRIMNYFIEDYVYMRNFITRLGISLITIFFIAVGAFHILYEGIIFPTSMQDFIDVYIKAYIGPWIIAMIVYTIISSIVYGIRYRKVSKRFNEYKSLVKELKRYEGQTEGEEGAANEI